MKILFANANYGTRVVGGAQVSIKHVAETLASSGHTVGVAYVEKEKFSQFIDRQNVAHFPLEFNNLYWHGSPRKSVLKRYAWHAMDRFARRMTGSFSQVLEKFKPDIVHTNVLGGLTTTTWKIANEYGIPIAHTVHDYYLICKNSGMRKDERNCSSQCSSCGYISAQNRSDSHYVSGVAYVSDHMRKIHEESGLFSKKDLVKSEIIGSFPVLKRIGPRKPLDRLTIGYLGRIAPDKGVHKIIEELEQLSFPIRFLLGGDGDENYIAQLKQTSNSVEPIFLGRVEPNSFYEQADILVVPSLWNEPAGRVAYEAGLLGIPVIVTNRGGLPQMVGYGERGWIYEPAERGSLAATITFMRDNWGEVITKANNWRRVEDQFSPEYSAAQTLNFYSDILKLRLSAVHQK